MFLAIGPCTRSLLVRNERNCHESQEFVAVRAPKPEVTYHFEVVFRNFMGVAVAVAVTRTIKIIELLADQTDGVTLGTVADAIELPKSAAYRILTDLADAGYVRQDEETGRYALTLKFDALGVRHLGRNGLVQVSRPQLMRLAQKSGALVRLSLVEGDELRFVSQFQGAKTGLRYDPDAGTVVQLSCSASGLAWLSRMSDDEALAKVYRQGIGAPEEFGPNAPGTLDELRAVLAETRARGWAAVDETWALGTAALAAPIVDNHSGRAVGVVSIAGPNVLLTEGRRYELSKDLLPVSADLSHPAVQTAESVLV